MNKVIMILGVVILIALGGYLLLGSNKSTNQPASQDAVEVSEDSMEAAGDSMESTGSGMMEGVKEFTIESQGLKFTPNEIRVKVGDTVRITYVNTLGTHDWTLDEFNVKTSLISAGEQETIEFVADQAGTFQFYCSVPGHRGAGMFGTLVVE
jgi:plastocyanin